MLFISYDMRELYMEMPLKINVLMGLVERICNIQAASSARHSE